jgi:hypothetical protein
MRSGNRGHFSWNGRASRLTGRNRVFSPELKAGVAQRILNRESVSALHQESKQMQRAVSLARCVPQRRTGGIAADPGVGRRESESASPKVASGRCLSTTPQAPQRAASVATAPLRALRAVRKTCNWHPVIGQLLSKSCADQEPVGVKFCLAAGKGWLQRRWEREAFRRGE